MADTRQIDTRQIDTRQIDTQTLFSFVSKSIPHSALATLQHHNPALRFAPSVLQLLPLFANLFHHQSLSF